ncbi:MAG: hypothetical protein P1U32_00440 [Legionellaceae bacterium]|nr:hypothetical protein [Legionellaceae bacterium]
MVRTLFFKLQVADAPVFSIDFPEAICPRMLPAILEVYDRFNVESSVYKMAFDCSDMSSVIQIQSMSKQNLVEQRVQAEAILATLARFCESCAINWCSFYHVKCQSGEEDYRPHMRLKQAMTSFIEKERLEARKTQFEAVVFSTLKGALSADFAAKYAIYVVEDILKNWGENVSDTLLEAYLTHRPH